MPDDCGEWRYLCSELVRVHYESAAGTIQQLTGNLEEISETVAILLLDTSVRRGQALSFEAQGRRLRGVVDSWVYEPPFGYFVSVRFTDGYRWREEHFRPKHFLKVARPARAKGQDAS
ncbi:MAG: hypothetical protein ABSF98_30340 [Bryobacteraceae bacterium]|jgi:hypothetical protein